MRKLGMLLISSIFMGCVSATNFNAGMHSFQAQNYRKAFILLKPQALAGVLAAEYAVGYMYYYGQGVVENRAEAQYWIRCAAQGGYPEAVAAFEILSQTSMHS